MEIELISERIADAIIDERYINKASLIAKITPLIKIWSKKTDKKESRPQKEEGDFIDRQVIKLQRKYSKDELVLHLNRTIKEKDFKIGKLTSEIDELKHQIIEIQNQTKKKANIEANKLLRVDELNQMRIKKIKRLEKELERCRSSINELSARLKQSPNTKLSIITKN